MSAISTAIRVLHVDDDPDLSALVASALEREDDRFEVTTATGPDEGLAVLAEERVDCVVSDYDMPGENGIEFLERVRAEYPDLPFILYTGKGSEEVASDAISAGVTDYLQKATGTDQYALLANRIDNAVSAARSRRALEERNRRLETLISNLPGIVYRCRNEVGWPMEFVAGECAEITGYDADAIESGAVSWGDDVVHPDERDRLWEAIQSALSAGEPFEVTYRIRTAEGETRWMWERGRSIDADGAGSGDRIEGFVTDVTERKEREQTLERYRGMVDAMPNSACIYDADGRFVVVNDYLAEFMGTTPEALEGTKSVLVEELRAEAEGDPFRELVEGDRTEYGGEIEGRFPGRGRAVVDYRLARLEIDGELDGIVAVGRDVTERRRRERELERQNERLDEFASIVSHDLRNPLQVATARLDFAREECDSDHLDAVERAHDRMEALIEDLLALGREGGTVLDIEPVDLGGAARTAWRTAGTAEAALVVDADATVRADRHRLQQLLENLLGNAVEHGPTSPASEGFDGASPSDERGDDVTVRIGPLDDGSGFYVADDGPGIDEVDRDRVFSGGYSTREAGTGFGLSVVERIAEAHGWSVAFLESESGGARFEIRGVEPSE